MNNWRNRRRPFVALAGCVAFGLQAAALAQTPTTATGYDCTFGESLRLISVEYPDQASGLACKVIYEKRSEGEAPRAIWTAKHDLNFCTGKMQSTVEKLTAGGWQCAATGAAGQVAGAAAAPTAPVASAPAATPPVASAPAPKPAMPPAARTPELDRVLPEKSAAPLAAAPVRRVPTSIPQKTTESTPGVMAMKDPAPVASGQEYDDWIFRWDGSRKKLVFTLYNSQDGRKARSFAWVHNQLDSSAPSPTNIVLAKDDSAKQVLIIAWPGENSQYITVIDPLINEEPICEIETMSKADSGWGYEINGDRLFLTGLKANEAKPGELVEFRRAC